MNKLNLALFLILLLIFSLFASGITQAATKPSPTPAAVVNKTAQCLAQQTKTKQNLISMVTLAQTMITQMDKINSQVISHYSLITLPSKKNLSEYDQMQSILNGKKSTINNSLKATLTEIARLSCTSASFSSDFMHVITNLEQISSSLEDYKSNLRSLIVGMIAVDQGGSTGDIIPSPSPTPSPRPTSSPGLNQLNSSLKFPNPSASAAIEVLKSNNKAISSFTPVITPSPSPKVTGVNGQ